MNKKLLGSLFSVLFSSVACASNASQENLWTETYVKAVEGFWGEHESASGPGSTLEQTVAVCLALPNIIKNYRIASILDVPCGDFNWMRTVDLGTCDYIGCEIVKPLVDENIKKYGKHNRIFLHTDVTRDVLPQVDLVICRDLFVHFSLQDIKDALRNFKRSGAKYLLATTFIWQRGDTNSDIQSGGWRTVNLEKYPFNFPAPLLLINEQCTEQNGLYSDKSMGLWRLDDVNV